jgi:Ca2+-binding RTX toxin-like protein
VIDQSTGALAFAAAPDFEDPADADGNNAYEVIVQVSDGVSGTDTQAILVGVAFDASVIMGTSQADVLIGGPGPNAISGGDGDDKLLGRAGDYDLDGGEGNDFLSGEGGNDLLTGGAGADLMWGAAGDDTYFVDNSGDRVIEGPNGGTDTVRSTIGYTLGSYVEDLVLDGGDTDGTGNKFDNCVTGSAGHNTLSGMIGRDRLEGGVGDDTLIGGRDSDTFVFKAGFGHDIITDFAIAGSYSAIGPEHDVLEFDRAVFADAAALFAHSHDTAEGVLIAADAGDTLLVKHTTMMKLQAHPEDFHFV